MELTFVKEEFFVIAVFNLRKLSEFSRENSLQFSFFCEEIHAPPQFVFRSHLCN